VTFNSFMLEFEDFEMVSSSLYSNIEAVELDVGWVRMRRWKKMLLFSFAC
jgi:hypothetical protein